MEKTNSNLKTMSKRVKKGYHICSITGVRYEGYGNNAFPFKGRCSDESNLLYVIPARIMGISPETINLYGKERIKEVIDQYHKEGKFNFIQR